jgi:two-component system response regulator AtoC
MIDLLEAIERLASEDTPVLFLGEPGTGKESLARVLHAQSSRRSAPFLALDARDREAAWDRIALAEGGTLFVDGVDALPPEAQRTLLGALRDGELELPDDAKPRRIDLRVLAATTRPLAPRVSGGRFDAELADALGEGVLPVPALRERREDRPLLLDHLLARAAAGLARPRPSISSDALSRVMTYAWPGNLRELECAAVRGVMRAAAGALTVRDLPDEIARAVHGPAADSLALKPARKDFEADWIRRALRVSGGNRTHAARLLEISHRALLYKLKEFGIAD